MTGFERIEPSVLTTRTTPDMTVVTAHVTGDFPDNPVDLRYQFKFAGP